MRMTCMVQTMAWKLLVSLWTKNKQKCHNSLKTEWEVLENVQHVQGSDRQLVSGGHHPYHRTIGAQGRHIIILSAVRPHLSQICLCLMRRQMSTMICMDLTMG